MVLSTEMNMAQKQILEQKTHAFNSQLKEKQKIVSKNSLEEADFLTLLVTQLKTQDPTKPMDDKQFIGQMAQFTSLKQMSAVAENLTKFTKEFDFTKSVSLVGKEISWTDATGFERSGIVDSVLMRDGLSFLKSDGHEVAFKEIIQVKNMPVTAGH